VEIFSGIVWGAYLIGINNFIYETVPSHARAGYNALSGFISGIGQFAGALIGGWLYSRLPAVWGSSFLPLLFISALGRVLAVVPMFMLVGETRKVAAGGPMELLGDIAGFRP
jgi:MFS family permease